MKLIINLCSLFIIFFTIHTVSSYSNGKSRFYNLIRQSMNAKDNDEHSSVLRNRQFIWKAMNQRLSPTEYNEQTNEEKRETWDSGEDQYFRWASQNRRPMESLGRKRYVDMNTFGSRPSRISGGIWRSGLVG
ncbi:unnamed protein product [Adineta ricciae]|uniref:Uncharacterized protein n=1 Tax=Adineta ricciae TaxID=249248 RepID=A0A814DDM3_ADIRI|nr:unnamed protein product [Adineta ricciae]CAF1094821.1 unnamed protein product [Adineta ricciae]